MKSESTTTCHTSVHNATEKKWVGGKRTYALPIHLSFYPWFSIRRSTPSGAGGHRRQKARSRARSPWFARLFAGNYQPRSVARTAERTMLLRPKSPFEKKADADVADTHRSFSHAMMQYKAAEIAQMNTILNRIVTRLTSEVLNPP